MTDALGRLRTDVTHGDVLRAIDEYDRLGPGRNSSLYTGFDPAGPMSWSGVTVVTHTRPSWAPPMSWPRANVFPLRISRVARAALYAVLRKLGFTVEDKQ